MVLSSEGQLDAAQTLELITKERVTFLAGAPTMYVTLMDHPDFEKRDLSSLKHGMCGGAPLTIQLGHDLLEKMKLKFVLNTYGLSECGGPSIATLSTDPVDILCETIGYPLPSARVKVVDSETGKRVISKSGEIWLHDTYPGSQLGKGYYNDPEKTRQTITEDGWFKTGDLGIEREDGYFQYVGRVKYDMFTVGGWNVYPLEIENCLMKYPKVAEAVVIGVPDPRMGEVVMAWVRPKQGGHLTEKEIIAHSQENLAAYKRPRYVQFYKDGELPMTAAGKVQKFKLREIASRELGL